MDVDMDMGMELVFDMSMYATWGQEGPAGYC
jgi:hypothetical protein